MKTGALILGILGGLVALSYGVIGFALGSIADAGSPGEGFLMKLISIALPVAALIGAGVVKSAPGIGAGLMAAAAVGFLFLLGFNFFSMIPVTLIGLGAFLGFLGLQEVSGQTATRD